MNLYCHRDRLDGLAEQGVNLCVADDVVLRKSVDRMRAVADCAGLVIKADVRMMVFLVCNPGHRIDEGRSLVIIAEIETRVDGFAVLGYSPDWLELWEQFADLPGVQWRNAAF